MKKNWWLAGLLAAACTALALFGQNSTNGTDMIYALILPFIWAGAGLRALSLSGSLGNAMALVLYASVSLLPLLPLIKNVKQKGSPAMRWLLVSMCAYLLFLMYFMVNPTMINLLFHPRYTSAPDMLDVFQAMLCMTFYVLLASYWVLAVMADKQNLAKQLSRLLYVFGAALIIYVFYINVADVKNTLSSLTQASANDLTGFILPNYEAALTPTPDGIVAVISFLCNSAPALLMLTAIPLAHRLLMSLESNFFDAANQQHAAAVALRCQLAVYATLCAMLLLTVLQLLLGTRLANVSIIVQMPLSVLALSLSMMLLSRYLMRSCAVQQENEMMI